MIRFDIRDLLPAILQAGRIVMSVYQKETAFTLKEDRSPLTEADHASHAFLSESLKAIAPGIPVLSEEGEQFPFEIRKNWDTYFLIDPLDGTKGFVRRTDEFTINIALIRNGYPVMGLIHAPVSAVTWIAESGAGAYRIDPEGERRLPLNDDSPQVRVVMSRDDLSPELEAMFARFPSVSIRRIGCSMKFSLIAEGIADFYPRRRGSMEWDTASGAVLVEEGGGAMCGLTGEKICYNREILLNPPFYAFNDLFRQKVRNWEEILFGENLER